MKENNKFIRSIIGRLHGPNARYKMINLPIKILKIYEKLSYNHVEIVLNDDNSLNLRPF